MPAVKQPETYLEALDVISPLMCWLLARKNRKPITQEEIARKTGWSKWKVGMFCGLKTWRGVTVGDCDKFRCACGITRANERRHRWYWKTTLDLAQTPSGLAHFRERPGMALRRIRMIKTKETR